MALAGDGLLLGKKFFMEFNLDPSLEILERTPDVLIALLQNISADWTSVNEGAESWSVLF
ncbi:MAG: hypothetical protein C4308_09290 [Chitinophagaceae bacterium]